MFNSVLSLVSFGIICSVLFCTQLSAALPHAKLRSGYGPSTMDSLTFVGNSMESSESEIGKIFQSSIPLSSYIANSRGNTQLNGGPIIFDEDYDEPLRPHPEFRDRNSIPGRKNSLSTTQTHETITKSTTQKTTPQSQLNKVGGDFQPIVFPSSTKSPLSRTETESSSKVFSTTTTTTTATTASPDECIQTEDNDCDEIIIDGSIYAQLIYRTPESNRLRPRNRKMHKTDGFFLA